MAMKACIQLTLACAALTMAAAAAAPAPAPMDAFAPTPGPDEASSDNVLAAEAGFVQAPGPAVAYVDPNQQTEGVSASLTGAKLGSQNPYNLTAATTLTDQKDPPNAGFTLISPHGTDAALGFNEEIWSYEYDGYNMDVIGPTVMVNTKDPKWPVLWTIFNNNPSDTQYAPIVIDVVNITWLDEVAQGLTDAQGNNLGYIDFLDAANNSAIGIVTTMANTPTEGIFGVMGSDLTTADNLVGGVNEPLNDDTFIPLTLAELNELINGTGSDILNSASSAQAGFTMVAATLASLLLVF